MPNRILTLIFGLTLACSSSLASAGDDDYARGGVYVAVDAAIGVPFSFADVWTDQMRKKAILEDILSPPPPGSPSSLDLFRGGRSDASMGVSARAGYRLHPHIAVEAQFEWISGFDYTINNNQKLVTGNTYLPTANVKGYAVAEGRFQPFLLFGVGYIRNESEFHIGDANAGTTSVLIEPDPVCVGPNPLAQLATDCLSVLGTSETVEGAAFRFGGGFDAYVTRSIGIAIGLSYVLPTGSASELDYLSTDVGLFYRF